MDRLAAKALLLFSVVWITGKLRTFFFFSLARKFSLPRVFFLSSLNFDFQTIRMRKGEREKNIIPYLSVEMSLSLSRTVKLNVDLLSRVLFFYGPS